MKSNSIAILTFCLFANLSAYSQQLNTGRLQGKEYFFSIEQFMTPSSEFAPFARWWWPGGDVTEEELGREIVLFSENRFGGVEIQPLNLGIPISRETSTKILSWDTPGYYEKLRFVLSEARRWGLTVDLTNGSGWPPGGSYLDDKDGFLSLNHADTSVSGTCTMSFTLPQPVNNSTVPSTLQAVIASKIIPKVEGEESNTIQLDPNSTIVLDNYVKENELTWDVPEGKWKIIAFWSMPGGEQTMIAASQKQGPVVDHLDSTKVLKNYDHLLGERTGLEPYFGDPLRAVFNDSYEFKVDRHYSPDLFKWFSEYRGYDIVPWLPANMQEGYNFVGYMNPHADPDFRFTDEDWRIRYDYDLTVGELLGEHFFVKSKEFLEKRGLIHRTQPYGLNMDMIAMAGLASIPETESMQGSEGILKLTTSGGHLYNKPIISSESVVFINKAYTTTPQVIRLAVDKLFAAGVNQVIYHGIPYHYNSERMADVGWYPFSTSFIPYINFSSNLGEGNPYWKYQKEINEYVTRTQYALRSGKAVTDVLIYYPFLNFRGFKANPEEIFTRGFIEQAIPEDREFIGSTSIMKHDAWIDKTWPVINELEKNGITWEWVNDASLQDANISADGQIIIRGNLYKGLILSDVPYIQMKSAENIKAMSSLGLNLLIYGDIPDKQPSFLDYRENDRKTEEYLITALTNSASSKIADVSEMNDFIQLIKQQCPVQFREKYSFTRQVERDLPDDSRIQFIWNKSDNWQTISLVLDNKYQESYWLNAEDGSIINNKRNKEVSYRIPPFSSIIFFASTRKVDIKNVESTTDLDPTHASKLLQIEKWNIQTDSITGNDSPLFDWKIKEEWKYVSGEGIYMSSFNFGKVNNKKRYLLDLGQVNYTAELYINGVLAGKRLYTPFIFDITPYIKNGDNSVEIRVVPTLLNGFIGNSKDDNKYRQFKGMENELMSEGLVGPVWLYEK